MNKEKIKSFANKHENTLYASALLFIAIFFLFITGTLDSIHYFRRSSVVETVTYKEDSPIRPIYLSWSPSSGSEDKLAPFLRSIEESPTDASRIVLHNGVLGKSVTTLTYGTKGIATGLTFKISTDGYLYLYNKDTNTYKGYDVDYHRFSDNKSELTKELKAKYGSAYNILPWKYKTERTIEVTHLKSGKVEVYLNEHYSVENQAEIDKAYEDAPKAE
jgi:hypothetical protein